MAFNIDPSISLNVKGQQQYLLGDLLNLASGVQSYKKAQQLNPIEIQQAQQNLDASKLTLLNKRFDTIAQTTADLMLKPDLTTEDIVNRARETNMNLGGNDQSLQQYLTGLPVGGSPKQLKAWLAQVQAKTLGAQARVEQLYPKGVLPNQLPDVSYEGSQDQQQNATQGNVGQTQTQSQQPQQGVTQDQMSKPTYSQPEALPYNVRTATSVAPYSPTEKQDQEEGFKVRNALVNRQSNLTTDRRNLAEAKDVATQLEKEEWGHGAGFRGVAGRNLSTFLGTEMGIKYKQLSKDLANVQISNIQAKGGSLDTVAGQQLQKMANGDETYPPHVLLNIISRAQADMTELDKKANAAQKFSSKFGDNNFKKFQQEWQKNADSKIFELYNVFHDPNMSDDDKKAYRDKILPKNEKERKVFQDKWDNIQKLEQTGSL